MKNYRTKQNKSYKNSRGKTNLYSDAHCIDEKKKEQMVSLHDITLN